MTGSTMLLRQVHPSFVQAGFASSQAFRPTPKDESKLSVYDGDQMTPEAAFNHFTQILKLASAGTVGLTVEECASVGIEARPDPLTDPIPFPEHAILDFSGRTDHQCKSISKVLKTQAQARGWLVEASTTG